MDDALVQPYLETVLTYGEPPLYARIDLLHDGNGDPRVSEVELIEPALYLAVHTPARQAFADAIGRELIIHG